LDSVQQLATSIPARRFGSNQQLQFVVQASTVGESAEAGDRFRYITTRQNVHTRLVEAMTLQ
jgi:hypothetical protein